MSQLDFETTKKLLKKYRIPYVKSDLCSSFSECKTSYPCVLKVADEKIVHKSDVGGVITGIENENQLKKAYEKLSKISSKLLVQKQIEGVEVIIGMKRDESFGPVIIFGLGGVLVEIIKDVSRRIAPVSFSEAKKMIEEIKGVKLLKGYRGSTTVDIDSLADIIVKLSELSLNEDLKEVDFNPVMASKKCYVVDARMIR